LDAGQTDAMTDRLIDRYDRAIISYFTETEIQNARPWAICKDIHVCKSRLMFMHVWRQTWPFTFSSRTGGGTAMPASFQLPRDVIRPGGVASPGRVTSTAKVKVKVGADSSSGQQQPTSVSNIC